MYTKIDVRQVLRSKLKDKAARIPNFVVNYLIRLIHQDELNDILERYHDLQGVDFMQAVVGYFGLSLNVSGLENLPKDSRKYIFVSNHPLGGLDGICLAAIIGKHFGGAIRYFVNDLLLYIPNLQSIFVPVNKHGSQNRETVSLTEEAYRSENQILTFPAGLCSRRQNGKIRDLEWKKSFIQKALEHHRDVVPIHFEGRNSNFFYRFANFRKHFGIKFNLEMLYLPSEMFKQRGKTFGITIGKPIPYGRFDSSKKPSEWADWVKQKVYELVS